MSIQTHIIDITVYDQGFSKLDSIDVDSFANHNRNYEVCMPSISRLIAEYDILPDDFNQSEKYIISISSQYTGDWGKIVNSIGVSGKGAALTLLRLALSHLLKDYESRNGI